VSVFGDLKVLWFWK